MTLWRTWFWQAGVAALGPTLLWASPFGPARDFVTAVRYSVFGYPAWLTLTAIWLLPGIALVKKFGWNEWYVLRALSPHVGNGNGNEWRAC